MIKQAPVSFIDSRTECKPYDENGFLPIIVSNMYSVLDKKSAEVFLDNQLRVCMPRNIHADNTVELQKKEAYFDSYSIDEFIENFITTTSGFLNDKDGHIIKTCVCIDTANGNMNKLHHVISVAKLTYKDKLVIMSGNVSTVESFMTLAGAGCDYIRVGIGGGGACSTTSNVGVGQESLEDLITEIAKIKPDGVKVVADGITSYIKYCKKKYGYNSNGYAAINKLLYCGADLVMVGKLFAQCVESAGDKSIYLYNKKKKIDYSKYMVNEQSVINYLNQFDTLKYIRVNYSGMSTQKEQRLYNNKLKPSEGSTKWIKVRWTLHDWLNGNKNQDKKPYLSGWINSVKSMMSYTNKKTLF